MPNDADSSPALPHAASGRPSTLLLILNFLSVYLIWGSTYLGIKFALEAFGVFPLAAIRFVLAGGLLYGYARYVAGAARPTAAQWRSAALTGFCLLFICNGTVVWAETRVSSGVTALVVAIMPLWMVLIDWLSPTGRRPRPAVFFGIAVGVLGVVLLLFPVGGDKAGAVKAADVRLDPWAVGALVVSCLIWSAASIYARSAAKPASPLLGPAMQMLCAGATHTFAGAITGQWGQIHTDKLNLLSVGSLAYLTFFGSIVAFTSYTWLLRATTAARVSTYAYVNPMVALFLGVALGRETLGRQTILAAVIILTAVVIITTLGRAPAPAKKGSIASDDQATEGSPVARPERQTPACAE